MERRDEGRERMGSQESQSVASIVSTPLANNNNSNNNVIRRGISIFSPTQTNLPPPHPVPIPVPDPDPTTSTTNTPKNPTPQDFITNTTRVITRYKECQKNHAASMGGHVVDGCGEFMPSGDTGTPESLRCAACDCHRNFHRKQVDNHNHQQQQHQNNNNNNNNNSHLRHGPTMVNFGGGPDSSSEEMNLAQPCSYSGSKKRFRTKFSQEQKDKMHELAERLGWRMQKQNEGQVQMLCNELGVKRQVFKVWMHNNKQAIKKRLT